MDSFKPRSPHFPLTRELLSGYSALFTNGKTLQKYIQHLRFAHRVLNIQPAVNHEVTSAILRGSVKFYIQPDRPSFDRRTTRLLARAAVIAGDHDLALVYAIAYTFMSRVQSEIFPLQHDGTIGLDSDDQQWHSRIGTWTTSPKRPHPSDDLPQEATSARVRHASIEYRRRKNANNGATLERVCTCSTCTSTCGVCAIWTLVARHHRRGSSSSDRILPDLSHHAALEGLKKHANAIDLKTRVGWHAFRRGRASDMLRSGDSLAQILTAGGWRSCAFLKYITDKELDSRVALNTTLAMSDSEGDDREPDARNDLR